MTEIYEIIETSEGEFSLRRADTEETPLVTISFSSDAMKFLNEASGEIAKTMIEAGIHEVEAMMEQAVEGEASEIKQDLKPLIH